MRSRWKNVLTAATVSAVCILVAAQAKGPETYGISGASFPEPGVLAAGQPTGEQVQLLAEDGYKTILDLRTPAELRGFDEIEAARQNGLVYVNVPVNPATLDQTTLDRFLAAMRKAQRPVLVHGGADSRVGALWYAWLLLEKRKPPAEALNQARAAGLHSLELTEKIQRLVAARPASP
jgi:protein tyrosine phosphatase (PTP) superfamily phosphohydrolase (DUF442 family)